MKILFKYLILLMTAAVFIGCLQTRSGSGSQQQSQVYRKKNIENQNPFSYSQRLLKKNKICQ